MKIHLMNKKIQNLTCNMLHEPRTKAICRLLMSSLTGALRNPSRVLPKYLQRVAYPSFFLPASTGSCTDHIEIDLSLFIWHRQPS